MFPDVTFLQLDLYAWCLVIGVIAALVVARVYADKRGVAPKMLNLCILSATLAIVAGYGFAILFQAVYNATENGKFSLETDTGKTFYGGLIGGAAVFFLLYFTLVRKFCPQDVKKEFGNALGIGACSVAIAHAIGRMGCFFNGCCYGKETDSWIGIYFESIHRTVIPTQLIEAIFLFLLFALLSFLLFRTKINPMYVYLVLYGVFRFVIEFWRDDERGASFIPALSPSQVVSLVCVLLGGALLVYDFVRSRRQKQAES